MNAATPPPGWTGWPDQKKFALVLSHDVDTAFGHKKCIDVMNLEKERGFQSSFNFVPEKYSVSQTFRHYLQENGFEVAVHGLKHDGKLFMSKKIFMERAARINEYLEKWGAKGFHAPSMHHNFDWIHALNIEYDQSTFDTDPFEPQPDGVGTIFPFWVDGGPGRKGYVELPYTLPQDHCLYVLMKQKDIGIWKKKIDWIAQAGGMALLNTHPDYMNFGREKMRFEEYPVVYYTQFLEYVNDKYRDDYWQARPIDVARYWIEAFRNS